VTPAARPAAPSETRPDLLPRPAWIALAVFAVAYIVAFAGIALMRVRYPFELEWMEGGAVDMVLRVLAGQPLYTEPGVEFTPFTYPPLYFWLGAGMAKLFGPGFVALRLLSLLATFGALWAIYATVAAERVRLAGVLAVGLFAASYREGGAWLDLARVDALCIAFVAAAVWAVRRAGNPFAWGAVAGIAFALAALTKQSALFIASPVVIVVLVTEWRRGVAMIAALAVLAGGVTAMLDGSSGGWYRFYAFDLPRHHPIIPQLLRGFWTTDLLGVFAIALGFGALHVFTLGRERWREAARDVAIVAGLLLTAYVTKIRVGSYDNLVIPAHLAAALCLGWGVNALAGISSALPAARRNALLGLACFLGFVQFTLLLYKPWKQIPPATEEAAGRQVVASLQQVNGDVWIPAHGYLARMAGKPSFAHELALVDVLRPQGTPQRALLLEKIRAALREKRFALVVLDHTGWLKDEVEPYYDHSAQMFGKDEPELFWSWTGFRTRPDFVWTPKPAEAGKP
jgi:hypothetical protein